MVLKKLTVFLFFILLSLTSFGTHIIGGEIFYECLGNDNYRITLKIYFDCYNGDPKALDNPANIGVFDSNGNVVTTLQFFNPVITPIPPVVTNPCLVFPPDICVEEILYQDIVNLPNIPGGYVLSYQRCCRNNALINISNPGGTGSTYTTQINDVALTTCNSNPYFKIFPPIAICVNDPIVFDHSAVDPDGDSLAYELCDPYIGGSAGGSCVAPDNVSCPIDPPPYTFVFWKPGFSGSYPLTSTPALAIDPQTGLLTGTPTQIGRFVVGVCVKEYRNGTLLSVNKRDFQFNIVQCNISVATFPTQTVYCDTLKVDFTNSSLHASTFLWDFGDPNLTGDTSNLSNPSFTYPDTGNYTVRLIINAGTQCVDTGYSSFSIHPLRPAIAPFSNQCFDGNNFNFTASGNFESTTTFSWNFGSAATPSSSTQQNPSGITYNAAGSYPVSVTMTNKGCSKTANKMLEVYPQPVETVTLPPMQGCAPFKVHFVDTSNTGNKLIRSWNFGIATSTLPDPTITYILPGTYSADLNIIAETVYGCKDTFSFSFPDIITTKPTPKAAFTVDTSIVSIFEPFVTITDFSFGASTCKLFFGDGDSSMNCNNMHTYTRPGKYTIMQVVENSVGCTDTFLVNIVVENEYRFYVPNAFTPNGDGLNDIFRPVVMGVSDYTFMIFNRWGELIFETHNTETGWDGRFKGELCPHEVYVYKINFLDLPFHQRHEFVGGVTLIR